jgi:hypothetical protein
MTSSVLAIVWLTLASFDIWFTEKRIAQYGLHVEYNPFIGFLSKLMNIRVGIWVGILCPSLLLLAGSFRFPIILSFLVGTRTTLAAFQAKQVWGTDAAHERTSQFIAL